MGSTRRFIACTARACTGLGHRNGYTRKPAARARRSRIVLREQRQMRGHDTASSIPRMGRYSDWGASLPSSCSITACIHSRAISSSCFRSSGGTLSPLCCRTLTASSGGTRRASSADPSRRFHLPHTLWPGIDHCIGCTRRDWARAWARLPVRGAGVRS